jgi:hypothetical protein
VRMREGRLRRGSGEGSRALSLGSQSVSPLFRQKYSEPYFMLTPCVFVIPGIVPIGTFIWLPPIM